MPFTLSHAAASLPFRRFKPVWPALVIGTFAPDLQYFINISDDDRSGHHFPQVLLFTIPFALLMLWVFERVVKGRAIELLPGGVQRRLSDKLEPLRFWGSRQLPSIIFWIAVGTATHLAWDQFTHGYSWLARHWALLRTMVTLPVVHTITVAHLLQHISTIGGLLVLAVWVALWYRRTPAASYTMGEEFSPWLKAIVVGTMCAIAVLSGYPLAAWRLADRPLPIRTDMVIAMTFIASTMVFCAQFLIYSLALTLSAQRRRIAGQSSTSPVPKSGSSCR